MSTQTKRTVRIVLSPNNSNLDVSSWADDPPNTKVTNIANNTNVNDSAKEENGVYTVNITDESHIAKHVDSRINVIHKINTGNMG